MKRIVIFLTSALCLATAIAQEDSSLLEIEETPEIRRYSVELIVFSYLEDVFVGTEQFLPDEPPPEEEILLDEDGNPLVELGGPVDVAAELEEPEIEIDSESEEDVEDEEPFNWVIASDVAEDADTGPVVDAMAEDEEPAKFELTLFTEDDYQLGDALRKFELLDAYETIMHVGWTQPTYPEEQTPPIELQLLGETPDGLNGTLTLYLSRYLHLVVDLALDAPVEVIELPDEESFFSYADARRRYSGDFDAPPQPVRYRIQENRIVRNGELRYFDHPKFGVLARIARIEEPEEAEEEEEPLLSGTGQ
jgi:hypothetical protein